MIAFVLCVHCIIQVLIIIQTLGVQGHSTLHMIRGRSGYDESVSISRIETRLGEVQEVAASTSNTSHRFFVYCKKPCKSLQPGKLRVRCADCKDQAFELITVS